MFQFKLQRQINPKILINVEFQAESGKITTLLGKSGAGKSSILNLIAGLISLDCGFIKSLQKDYTNIPVHKRQFGYVQQQSHLFPHLNVLKNITYSGDNSDLEKYIEIFELIPHLTKMPQQLSGGEAQRVALVRTLMSKPQLLLLDEAFSALDIRLRHKLQSYLKTLKIPIIFITHDLMEAYELSDQILVIENGNLIEKGNKTDIFHHCRKLRTAQIIGIENIYPAYSCENSVWIENFESQKLKPDLNFKYVGIKGNEISFAKNGYLADLKSVTCRLNDVMLELEVIGLSKPLIATLSWREYEQLKNQKQLHFNINELIYLED